MARAQSKIMTVAEKKVAEAGLKSALKDNQTFVKASELAVTTANKALADAKKKADQMVAESNKAHERVLKESGKLIAAAQKVVDAETKKHTKVFDAAIKGREKLTSQLETLTATPVEHAKRGPKPKIKAEATA
jgi:DNA-binding ferritin-like protein